MYKIFFADNTIFEGGDLHNTKWNEMTDKSIQKIEFYLFNKTIIMQNYESYNLLKEKSQIINKNSLATIDKIFLMGKNKDMTLIYVFDLKKQESYPISCEYGKEYYNKSVTGWKKGLLNQNPSIEII